MVGKSRDGGEQEEICRKKENERRIFFPSDGLEVYFSGTIMDGKMTVGNTVGKTSFYVPRY